MVVLLQKYSIFFIEIVVLGSLMKNVFFFFRKTSQDNWTGIEKVKFLCRVTFTHISFREREGREKERERLLYCTVYLI